MSESEGVSTRYLLGAFFAVVLLCAVFFSLGYFLGYREGHPSGALLTERVAASSDVAAPVNTSSSTSSAAEPGAQPVEEQSPRPSDSESNSQAAASDTTNPAQSDAAPPPGATPTSSASALTAAPTQPAGDAGAAGDTDDTALTPRSVPSGLLIQVGAMASRQEASKMADALHSKGYSALVLTPTQVGAKDNFFRVVAGPYRSRESATVALRKLTGEGYRPFIRQ